MISGYLALARLGLGLASVLALTSPAFAAEQPGRVEFQILRNGQPFGRQGVTVTEIDGLLVAQSSADLRASLGPIALFTYAQRCNETWRDGALTGLICATRTNGQTKRVNASLDGGALNVTSGRRAVSFPVATLPTSWWTRPPLTIREMINSETGARLPVRVSLIGREMINVAGRQIAADHMRVVGTVAVDLWYDAAGHWVNCEFSMSGQHMTYRLVTPVEQAPH